LSDRVCRHRSTAWARVSALPFNRPASADGGINQPLQDFFAVAMAYNVKLLRAVPLNYFTYFFHWQTLVSWRESQRSRGMKNDPDDFCLTALADFFCQCRQSITGVILQPAQIIRHVTEFFRTFASLKSPVARIASAAECNNANMTFLS
jgi:hypothetical protein